MTRQSPAVFRAATVLDFFADRPLQAFTLTDISRAVKLSAATCHGLLAAFVERGYLYRNRDKTYVLGPRLVRIGRIANEYYSPLAIARPQMRLLADEHDAVCTATAREGDELVTYERAASPSHVGWRLTGELRRPLRYPTGIVVMAWEPQGDIDIWLANANPGIEAAARKKLQKHLQNFRSMGFCIGLSRLAKSAGKEASELHFPSERTTYLVSEIEPEESYEPAFIAAPMLNTRGSVDLALALVDFRRPLSGRDVKAAGLHLRSVCDRIGEYSAQPRVGDEAL